MSDTSPQGTVEESVCRLNPELPLSVVLGAGSVRGLAHIGVLEVLLDAGFRITELVGTSVGAVILAFYAAVGLDLEAIGAAGLSLKSQHLLMWAVLRHSPPGVRNRLRRFAGIMPEYIDRLAATTFYPLHHGVQRIGIVSHDALRHEEVVCHSAEPVLRLEDAVRGAAALPGVFPSWKCVSHGRHYRLVDGGVTNRLPAEVLFQHPFMPAQVLAVDISSRPEHRGANLARVADLRRRYPNILIDTLCVDTLGGATIMYRSGYLSRLLASGRHSAQQYLSGPAALPNAPVTRIQCPHYPPT